MAQGGKVYRAAGMASHPAAPLGGLEAHVVGDSSPGLLQDPFKNPNMICINSESGTASYTSAIILLHN